MRKNVINTVLCAIIGIAASSCSKGIPDAIIYGEIPGILAEYNAENSTLKEKAREVDNADDFAKLAAKADKLKDGLKTDLQKAGEKYSGTAIVAEGINGAKIEKPLTLIYDGFFSSTTVRFKVDGEVVTTEEITLDFPKVNTTFTKKWPDSVAKLISYDAEGNELRSQSVGSFETVITDDGRIIIPAGSKMKFNQSLTIGEKGADDALQAKTLKVSPY